MNLSEAIHNIDHGQFDEWDVGDVITEVYGDSFELKDFQKENNEEIIKTIVEGYDLDEFLLTDVIEVSQVPRGFVLANELQKAISEGLCSESSDKDEQKKMALLVFYRKEWWEAIKEAIAELKDYKGTVADVIDSIHEEEIRSEYDLVKGIKSVYGDDQASDFYLQDLETILSNLEFIIVESANYCDVNWFELYDWLGNHSEYVDKALSKGLCEGATNIETIIMEAQCLWHEERCQAEIKSLVKTIQEECG